MTAPDPFHTVHTNYSWLQETYASDNCSEINTLQTYASDKCSEV